MNKPLYSRAHLLKQNAVIWLFSATEAPKSKLRLEHTVLVFAQVLDGGSAGCRRTGDAAGNHQALAGKVQARDALGLAGINTPLLVGAHDGHPGAAVRPEVAFIGHRRGNITSPCLLFQGAPVQGDG